MGRLNISLPPKVERALRKRLMSGEYQNAEEYVRALIQRDQSRSGRRKLEAKLIARLDRKGAVEMDAADFAAIRARVTRAIARRKTA
jgi:putative addiction module CopG family antidote